MSPDRQPLVEGIAGGEGEETDRDAGEEVSRRARAVAFECEQVCAGVENGLDPLPDRGQVKLISALLAAEGALYLSA